MTIDGHEGRFPKKNEANAKYDHKPESTKPGRQYFFA